MTRPDGVVHCLPGDHHAIVWPGGVALLDGSVPASVAARLWGRMRTAPELGAFLQALAEASGSGLLDLPDFVIAIHRGDRFHVAVRGEGEVTARGDAGVHTLTGAGITTWAERSFPLPVGVVLTMGDAADQEGASPMVDGVTRAGTVHLGEVREPSEECPPAEDRSPVVEDQPVVDPPPRPAPARATSAPEPARATSAPEPARATSAPERSIQAPSAPAAPAPVASAVAASAPAASVTSTAANPYRSLWEKTRAVDVEAAAVRIDSDAASMDVAHEDAAHADNGHEAEEPRDGGDHVDLDDQRHGDTVLDEGFADIAAPVESAVPQVLSRFCAQGHANPPERSQCFTCDSAVVGEARRARRPQLGWLRVEGGETIPLAGPVVAGRNPSSASLRLSEPARLVALPHAHVSGTHVAFLLEGWRVMVHDLGSRNGTYLRRHGKPPVRLPAAPHLLVPGDLIDLGKGLFLHLDRIP